MHSIVKIKLSQFNIGLMMALDLIFIVGFHSVAYHKMYKSSRQMQLITALWASNKLVTKLHVSAPLSHHQVQDKA
jgi:hypothetical protein